MTDDRFDQELAARLRAYESRLPDQPAPQPGSGASRRRGLPILLAGGAAAVAAVVLALVVMQGWGPRQVGEPSQSPTAVPTIEPSPTTGPSTSPVASSSQSPSPSPSASSPPATSSPRPATTELEWTVAGSFPAQGEGPSMVQHLVRVADGYVAIGVEYTTPLPNLGPAPAHALRTWWSADGRGWEVVEQGAAFDNVEFTSVAERPDGSLLAIGLRSAIDELGAVSSSVAAAWTSPDGRTWTEADSGLPNGAVRIVQGGRGYVALVQSDPAAGTYELWHSADAVSWVLATTQRATQIDVAAGDEGFVAVGAAGAAADEPFALASGDGLEWIPAGTPPGTGQPLVGSLAGDWIVMSAAADGRGTPAGRTWASANGLEWAPLGAAPLSAVEVDGVECREYARSLRSAGPWLVASTDLSHPCSEGGFTVRGSQFISVDGSAWTALPFSVGTPGRARSGSLVNTAMEAGGSLILGGELDGVATIWFGAQP